MTINEPGLDFTYYDSPVGSLLLAGTTEALYALSFPTGPRVQHPRKGWRENAATFEKVATQLDEYFAGERLEFDLELVLVGTEFQKDVWKTLQTIPFGQTMSYGQLAQKIERPKAFRAVGAANGANNLPIILPCHRVIGANKSLTGFGGGLPTKEFLLRHEQSIAPPQNHQGLLFA